MEVDRQPDLLLQRPDQRRRPPRASAARPCPSAPARARRPSRAACATARSTSGRISTAPDRAGRRCSRSPPRRSCRTRRTASIATRMFSTQFSESKTRNRSIPRLRRLRDEGLHDVVGIVGVSDPVRRPQQHLRQHVRHPRAQIRSRSHGHSCRKRYATSNVAPPQHSTLKSCGSRRA